MLETEVRENLGLGFRDTKYWTICYHNNKAPMLLRSGLLF